MADLRFNVEQAVEQLQAETKRAAERLAETAAALERELRAVGAALEAAGPGWDVAKADAFHVLELDTREYGVIPVGGDLVISMYGRQIGAGSRIARPLEPGKYRAIVQITRAPLHCSRCGTEGHEASRTGPAGDNCREAIGQTSSRRP